MDLAKISLDKIKIKRALKLYHMYFLPNTEVPRSIDTPLYVKKEQKINDRLQDKINILKSQTNSQAQDFSKPQPPQINKDTSLTLMQKKTKEAEVAKK